MADNLSLSPTKIVPILSDTTVPIGELVHGVSYRKYISEDEVKEFAIEKYKSNGKGIIFKDIVKRFPVKKSHAQRSLKYFRTKDILFTAEDLLRQGINLIRNKSLQEYSPTCIKANIIVNLRQRRMYYLTPRRLAYRQQTLPEALENIRYPYKSIENRLDELSERIGQYMDLLTKLCDSMIDRSTIQRPPFSDDWNGGSRI
jgi:hypothetical protein